MKVVSLFDGMGCGLTALKRIGATVTEYHAFEIDAAAIAVARNNHPEIIHHGSVTEADFRAFEGADLLIGGSPCQGFSFAGKQLAFGDPRSELFFEFVRAKEEIVPARFLLENVKMQKAHLEVINQYMGVEPILINSARVSAQNRQRYYWCNWYVEQPDDRGVMLADILENDVKSVLSAGQMNRLATSTDLAKRFSVIDPPKAACMTARQYANWKGTFVTGGRVTGRRDDYNTALTAERRLERREDGRAGCLTTVRKDSVIVQGESYRQLTPVECERLQTLPDGYTAAVSDTQRYKMLGNGWTVDVVAHILTEGCIDLI